MLSSAATDAADSSRTCSGPSSVDFATYWRAAAIVRPRTQAAVAAVVVAAVAEQWSSRSLAVYH